MQKVFIRTTTRIRVHLSVVPHNRFGDLVDATLRVEQSTTTMYQSRPESKKECTRRFPVIPEKFQFLEKGQNSNFGYEIVISVKNVKFIL